MHIRILQGERDCASHNICLGDFTLENIPLAKRGEPHIEVAFRIDVNGIVHVSAKDLHTESEKNVSITSGARLSQVEVERMIQEAQQNATQDARKKETIQASIQADNMICAATEFLEETGHTLDERQLGEIDEAIFELKSALAEGQLGSIRARMKRFRHLMETANIASSPKGRSNDSVPEAANDVAFAARENG